MVWPSIMQDEVIPIEGKKRQKQTGIKGEADTGVKGGARGNRIINLGVQMQFVEMG